MGFSDFTAANILMIAGGGGGADFTATGQSSSTFQATSTGPGGNNGGNNGGGGGSASSNGQDSRFAEGGRAAINGAAGGTSSFTGQNGHGGFGGGGAGHHSGGGGGGATGGNAGSDSENYGGRAGTSYNGGANPVNTPAANSGHGFVTISYGGPPEPLVCRDISTQLNDMGMVEITPEMVVQPPTPDTSFSYTGSLQSLEIPTGVTSVRIEATGAMGGNETACIACSQGGRGALVSGEFAVTPGETLQIIVGQKGSDHPIVAGGGGASFVAKGSMGFSDFTAANLLLIAGGGGGALVVGSGQSSTVFQTTSTGPGGSNGGNNGGGGGSAGSDGEDGSFAQGGRAAINGAAGGGGAANGGFGGGGGGYQSGGGGGGATGGNAGTGLTRGWAGTSYNGGVNPVNIPAAKSGHGYVNVYYNYDLANITVSPDKLDCNHAGTTVPVEIIRTNCDGSMDTCMAMVTVPPKIKATNATLDTCEVDNGKGIFDLTLSEEDINGGTGVSYAYYSDSDATMSITSPYTATNGTKVYVVVTDDNFRCSGTAELTLYVTPAPKVTCNEDTLINECITQAEIDAAFATWLEGFTNDCVDCEASDLSVYSAPDSCGGEMVVKYVVTDLCGTPKDSCTRTFEVMSPMMIAVTCPVDVVVSAELSDQEIMAAFDDWLNSIQVMDGCNVMVTNDATVPVKAGYCTDGITTVNWMITSTCEETRRCSATFTIEASRGGEDPPNCSNFSPAVLGNGDIVFGAPDLLTNSDQAKYPVTGTILNQWGGVIKTFELQNKCEMVTMNICNNLGNRLDFNVKNSRGTCNDGIINLNNTPPLIMTSAYQSGGNTLINTRSSKVITGPHISQSKINVYCGQIPDPSDHIPAAEDVCTGKTYTPKV